MRKPPTDGRGPSPKPASPPAEPRRGSVREVGALLPQVGGMAFRRFGFVQGALLARWREVVGPVYARWSVPQSLRFPRGEQRGGTLTICVEGPFSVQLQHVAPQIIDRANRILGHGAVARIRLVQGEVPRPAERTPVPAGPVASTSATNLAGIGDEGLRAALQELSDVLGRMPEVPKVR